MSRVEFKKWSCRMSLSYSCPMLPLTSKMLSCRMSNLEVMGHSLVILSTGALGLSEEGSSSQNVLFRKYLRVPLQHCPSSKSLSHVLYRCLSWSTWSKENHHVEEKSVSESGSLSFCVQCRRRFVRSLRF